MSGWLVGNGWTSIDHHQASGRHDLPDRQPLFVRPSLAPVSIRKITPLPALQSCCATSCTLGIGRTRRQLAQCSARGFGEFCSITGDSNNVASMRATCTVMLDLRPEALAGCQLPLEAVTPQKHASETCSLHCLLDLHAGEAGQVGPRKHLDSIQTLLYCSSECMYAGSPL